MDVSEQALLTAIRKVLSGAGPEVRLGVGDDAAVVAPGSGELVLTTDALVEGSHFSRATTSASRCLRSSRAITSGGAVTVMSCVSLALLLALSVAVQVMVVVPRLNVG